MLNRLDAAVPDGTRVVILQPGGNDARHGAASWRDANTSQIVERLRARQVAVIMLENQLIGEIRRQGTGSDGQHLAADGYRLAGRSTTSGGCDRPWLATKLNRIPVWASGCFQPAALPSSRQVPWRAGSLDPAVKAAPHSLGANANSGRRSETGILVAPPNQPQPEQRRTEESQTGRLGRGEQLASNLSAAIIDCMDVEIGLSPPNPRDQRCFGLCEPALQRDESRIVNAWLCKIEHRGAVRSGRHPQREARKRGRYGSHSGIGAERRATMNVRHGIVRRQAAERSIDLERLCGRIEYYSCPPRRRRCDRGYLVGAAEIADERHRRRVDSGGLQRHGDNQTQRWGQKSHSSPPSSRCVFPSIVD